MTDHLIRRVVLTAEKIGSRESMASFMKEALQLPDYFGGNLDALYDILSEQEEAVTIEIIFYQMLSKNLGDRFSSSFWRMLGDLNVNVIKHA